MWLVARGLRPGLLPRAPLGRRQLLPNRGAQLLQEEQPVPDVICPGGYRGPQPHLRTSGLPPKVRVRCLGPAKREHTFLSADPKRERICPRCRQLQKFVSLTARGVSIERSIE